MADNVSANGVPVATRSVTYSGDAAQNAQVVGLVAFSGSDDAKTATDLPGDASNGLDVDVTRLPALVAGSAKIGAVDLDSDATAGSAVPGTGQYVMGTDGTNARGLKTDTSGELQVDVLTLPTATVQQSTASSLKVEPAGNVAHDGADSGNPVKVGGRAISDLAGATMVAAADRTDLITDLDGVLVVKPFCPLGNVITEHIASTNATKTTTSNFGTGTGIRNHITSVVIHNSSANDTYVQLFDGNTSTVLGTFPAPTKGGCAVTFPVPLRQGSANTALFYQVNSASTTVFITLVGFRSKA